MPAQAIVEAEKKEERTPSFVKDTAKKNGKSARWHRLFLSPSINGKEVYSRAQKRARSE
jgi:hypothetical protein